jgi:hypothetical protein
MKIGDTTSWGKIQSIKDNIIELYCNFKTIEVDKALIMWDLQNTMSKTKMVFNTTIKQLKPIA